MSVSIDASVVTRVISDSAADQATKAMGRPLTIMYFNGPQLPNSVATGAFAFVRCSLYQRPENPANRKIFMPSSSKQSSFLDIRSVIASPYDKLACAVVICASALVLLATFSGQILAQETDSPISAGELIAAYEESEASCVKSDYEELECSESFTLARQLMDLGLCRLRGADPVFKTCQTYRSYFINPILNGYHFGFENSATESSFSAEFSSHMPHLDGTMQMEKIGHFTMVCTSGKSPFIIIEIEADYPNFVVRDDKINFIALLEGYGGPSMARAIAGDDPTKGVFYIGGSEIVPKVLQFYSIPIGAVGGLDLTMKLTAYEPEAVLELMIMPLWLSYEAITRPTEMVEHLQAMVAACS